MPRGWGRSQALGLHPGFDPALVGSQAGANHQLMVDLGPVPDSQWKAPYKPATEMLNIQHLYGWFVTLWHLKLDAHGAPLPFMLQSTCYPWHKRDV